ERGRLFGAVIAMLAELARSQPVLLVLDDLHWARRPTIDLLDQLTRDQQLSNVLIVATYRTAPADTGEALRDALPDLRRLPGVTRLPLGGLDVDGIEDFVAAAAGHAVGSDLRVAVDVLARQTDGNVFLLVELWQHLVEVGLLHRERGRWTVTGPLTDVVSPEGVREVAAARLGRLDVEAREVLQMAAVIGATFDPAVLAAATGQPVGTVLARLDAAVRARIVGEYGAGSYRFAHELIRRSVYDGLGSGERRGHHLAVARALDAGMVGGAAAGSVGGSARMVGGSAAEIAQHLAAAVPLVDPRVAVAAAVHAADAATGAVAYHDAARFLEAALAIAPDSRVDLLLRLADATMRAGDVARAKHRCLEAHDLAQRTGDGAGRIAAALAFGDAAWRDARDGSTAARLLRGVLPLAADEITRVRLQASLTRALAFSGDSEAAAVLGEDALASARTLGDPYALRVAFEALSFVPGTPQNLHRQLALMRESAQVARANGDLEWENAAVDKALYSEIMAGDLDAARATAVRDRELAALVGQPLFRALDCQAHALLAMGEGRFDEAEALAAEGDALAASLTGAASGGYGVQLFSIRREQGRLDEARPIVEAVARLGRSSAAWRPALAVMYAELGLHDEAAAEVTALTADRLAAVPRDALWTGALSYLADACCAVGDLDSAAAVYDELVGWRGLVVQVGHLLAAHGAVDRYLGALAVLLGHEREAEIHFEAALRLDGAARMPVWLAHSQLEYGRFLARRMRPADGERAATMLEASRATAERLGMATVAGAAGVELDELRGGRVVPAVGGLTSREVAVLQLIAEGRSNREIGLRLHISPHTAANHVRSILMKTECANRTEAAAWALHRGIPGVPGRGQAPATNTSGSS
ncbi:MAG: LuxR C-terminal-related transcriptional regulator, partial [Ilumatobacteraceae bacterium]